MVPLSEKDTKHRYDVLREHSRQSNAFVKECLKTAMIQLAKEKDYNEITITALCKRAGVSRMAFYRNYQIPNDVIYEIARDLNTYVINLVGSPFRCTVDRRWYIQVFESIALHREEMSLMFQENFQYQWMKIVNDFAVHDPRFSPEKKYQRMMWAGGFENVVSYWLNNGMTEPPEELADYCLQYLPHLLME